MAFEDASTVVPSAARTTSGNSGAIPCPKAFNLAVGVNVTAATGTTPSLALSVEWSHDGVTFLTIDGAADTFTAITTTGTALKVFAVKAPFWRLSWAITGTTPSFTFTASRYGIGD